VTRAPYDPGWDRWPDDDDHDDRSWLSSIPFFQVVALAGLVVVTLVTFGLSTGRLPISIGHGPSGGGGSQVGKSPTPSNVVVVPDDPRAKVPGSIVYAKDGNIWIQGGSTATELTTGGGDLQPSFSADGSTVWFIRTRQAAGLWPADGGLKQYVLTVPSVVHVPVAGGPVTTVLDGLVDPSGKNVWSAWIRQPVVSPAGATVALVSDLPSPGSGDVVLQLLDVASGKLTNPKLVETSPFGHQDPAWSPDGTRLAYVRNDRDATKGTPQIWVYTLATKKAAAVTGPGYIQPAWSPDGRWLVATRTSAFGTDVVVLDATTGGEVLRVTDDGASWDPTWSPAGNALAFLHVTGQVVDLRMVTLLGSGPAWRLGDALDLTTGAGLDSLSRPGWWIPEDLLPKPTPTPVPSPSPAGSGASASPVTSSGATPAGSPKPS
jgi:Tol biopolymer transport system component